MKLINLLKTSSLAAAAILLADNGAAQTEAGKWQLSLGGSYSHSWVNSDVAVDTSLDIYSGSVDFGYFMLRSLEIKGGISVIGIDGSLGTAGVEGSANAWVVPVSVGLDYHINTRSKFVPYVGGALGVYVVGAGFGEDWGAAVGVTGQLHAGLKQFVKENVAIVYQVSYDYIPLPDDVSLSTVSFSIGLSFMF